MISMDKFTSMHAGSLYHRYFYLYLSFVEFGSTQVNVFQQKQAYCLSVHYRTIKQLNKTVTAYDSDSSSVHDAARVTNNF